MKKVAVVILNYKVRDQVIKCIQSVNKSTYKNLQIIVVDNNSGDGVGQALKDFKEIIFIQNNDNLGYTGGNNVGIKRAIEEGSDIVFVLNADTTIDSKCIEETVKSFDDKSVGIVGPKILFEDKETIWFAGGVFDRNNVLGGHRGVDEKDHGQYDTPTEPDYITGGAMFISREVLEKIGMFDERFFLYYEDSDLSFRVKAAGFKLMYNPKAIVFHKNAQSTGLGSPLQDYFITRNRMLFASKFLPFRTRFALFREALKNITIPARRLALYDFLTGSFGKGHFK